MNVTLCSIPAEAANMVQRRKRSEGHRSIIPKIAITSLNSWAIKNGFPNCKFYDIDMLYPSDEEIKNFFIKNPTDIVGLSAVVSTSYTQVKRISKIIKEVNKKTLIVCGGYITAAADTVLRKTLVDVCVVGDGEIAWIGLLKLVKENLESKVVTEDLLKIKGIAVLDDNGNLQFSGYGQTLPGCEMTFPDFEYLKSGLDGNDEAMKNYFRPFWKNEEFSMDSRSYEKHRQPMMMSIFTSKGCVAKCTFCQRGSKGYTVYDLSKLEAYIKHVKENYNVGFLYVDDENFGSNRKYAYQVAELFHKYDFLWWAGGVRCSTITEADVIHYKKNGCCGLCYGIESGSQTMLDVMEKKITVEDVKRSVNACYDNGLYSPLVRFIVGMPGESMRTCRESGQLIGELTARIGVSPGLTFGNTDIPYAAPLIGTPLYEYGNQLGLIGQNLDEDEKYLELTSNSAIFKRYYLNFNGAPMSEVIFWDMLVFLEATREWVKRTKNKVLDQKWENKFILAMEIQGQNPHVKAKQKKVQIMGSGGETKDISFSNYFITNFLKQYVVFNTTIAKLPRFIVEPAVRYLLYFEFLIQKYFLKDKHNLHTVATTNKKIRSKIRIREEELDPTKTSQKDRSLRTIVGKKMKKFNNTKVKETISSLTAGP